VGIPDRSFTTLTSDKFCYRLTGILRDISQSVASYYLFIYKDVNSKRYSSQNPQRTGENHGEEDERRNRIGIHGLCRGRHLPGAVGGRHGVRVRERQEGRLQRVAQPVGGVRRVRRRQLARRRPHRLTRHVRAQGCGRPDGVLPRHHRRGVGVRPGPRQGHVALRRRLSRIWRARLLRETAQPGSARTSSFKDALVKVVFLDIFTAPNGCFLFCSKTAILGNYDTNVLFL